MGLTEIPRRLLGQANDSKLRKKSPREPHISGHFGYVRSNPPMVRAHLFTELTPGNCGGKGLELTLSLNAG